MEIETHRTIRALLVLPSILAYSAVIVYFLKDIGIDDIEKMRYIAQANMRFPFFILFISFILIKLR
ncbi:hypothetical protein, partial [Stenoxybacter acetivorans]|uniref:hypothetical protein n=1 Tax=Stenoxybacter acetivorans TaxID=422441 RepID=UPI0012EBC7B9